MSSQVVPHCLPVHSCPLAGWLVLLFFAQVLSCLDGRPFGLAASASLGATPRSFPHMKGPYICDSLTETQTLDRILLDFPQNGSSSVLKLVLVPFL